MSTDRPVLGILLMLGFCVVAPLGDAVTKLLGGHIGILHLLLVRFALQALLLWPLVLATGRAWRMSGRVLRLAWLRTLLHMAGIGAMFAALQYMPLADAVAIAFVMPFIMLLLGRYVLGEEVGPRRMWACAVGFLGTLLVIQPSFVEVGWYALLPLGVAVNFAFFMLVTRSIARDTDPIGLQAVNGLMATALILPLAVVLHGAGWLRFDPATLAGPVPALLVLLGVMGTSAHLLMTWSLRFAPAATLAPMQYLEIPVATVTGLVIFGDLPDALAGAGIALTVGAGLYVVLREQALQRRARRMVDRAAAPMGDAAP